MRFPCRAGAVLVAASVFVPGLRAQAVPAAKSASSSIMLDAPQLVPPDGSAPFQQPAETASTWQFLAGAGFALVAPFTDNNRAFTLTTPGSGAGQTTQSTEFGNSVSVAPRFWLGMASPGGWGFRTSYWHFGQSNSLSAAVNGTAPAGSILASGSLLGIGISTGTFLLGPGNADVMTATSSLNLNVLDFEVTREIEAGQLFLMLSAGGRYAQLGQHYNASIVNTANNFLGSAEVDQLFSRQRITAGGPTFALQGWYPLGRTRFSLYGLARGSILFGNNRQDASTSTITAAGGVLTETPQANVSGSRNAAVPIGEMEIGIQWTGVWGRFYPFLRTAAVAQSWFNALTATTVPTATGDTANLNTNLSFFGVAFQAGLSY